MDQHDSGAKVDILLTQLPCRAWFGNGTGCRLRMHHEHLGIAGACCGGKSVPARADTDG